MNVLCDRSAFTGILNCTAERCTSIILTADLMAGNMSKLCCKDLKCTLHRIYLLKYMHCPKLHSKRSLSFLGSAP